MAPSREVARRRAKMPEGTEAILNLRSLEVSHKRLAEMLQPGMTVLDVGCGSGAITAGMARRVQPGGEAVGVDINPRLIEEARATYTDLPGLTFSAADVYALPFDQAFDVVTCARVLQWLSDPEAALRSMVAAAVPEGRVVVLDYNHEKLAWSPSPPPSVLHFYAAFLRWRANAGMDNTIADRLGAMFSGVGLRDVTVSAQHEVVKRGDPGFDGQVGIWAAVMATRGKQMVADGALSEIERDLAERDYRDWMQGAARSQTMYLLVAEGAKGRTAPRE